MKNDIINQKNLEVIYKDIRYLIVECKKRIYTTVNVEMLKLYWNIGKIIVDIQGGEERAKYGQYVLKELADMLTNEFGKGFSKKNLEYMRRFYLMFPIAQTLSAQLNWSHYTELIKIKNEER